MKKTNYQGKRILLRGILLYRKVLRQYLPPTRCSFLETESCSTYGKRIVSRRAGSLREAMKLIRTRRRRCRDVSLYKHETGLLWREPLEDPDALALTMYRAGEKPASVLLALQAAWVVGKRRGLFSPRAGQELQKLQELHGGQITRPVLRSMKALRRSEKRGLGRTALLCLILLSPTPFWPSIILLSLPLALGLFLYSLLKFHSRRQRFQALILANQFEL